MQNNRPPLRSNGNTEYSAGYITQSPIADEAHKPKWSGLYDAYGIPLYRKPNPIGYETDYSRKTK